MPARCGQIIGTEGGRVGRGGSVSDEKRVRGVSLTALPRPLVPWGEA